MIGDGRQRAVATAHPHLGRARVGDALLPLLLLHRRLTVQDLVHRLLGRPALDRQLLRKSAAG